MVRFIVSTVKRARPGSKLLIGTGYLKNTKTKMEWTAIEPGQKKIKRGIELTGTPRRGVRKIYSAKLPPRLG